jgi:hypothetical protein
MNFRGWGKLHTQGTNLISLAGVTPSPQKKGGSNTARGHCPTITGTSHHNTCSKSSTFLLMTLPEPR